MTASDTTPLEERLAARIEAAGGSLRFDRFMETALYDPHDGYYTAGRAIFGAAGDFTTASEITPLYGATLARGLVPVLSATEGVEVVEIGAGTGAFAAALLDAIPAALRPERYVICELSAPLAARQRELLAAALPDYAGFVWAGLNELSRGPKLVIANEVLDALPVRRFVKRKQGLTEQYVTWDEGALALCELPAGRAAARRIAAMLGERFAALPDGYVFDYNARIAGFLKAVGVSLTTGSVWLVDYGETRAEYYHPGRSDGTLVSHYRHQVGHDPLARPGEQDLTAAVDFTRVAEAATACGFSVAGFATQAHVLLNLGLDAVLAAISDEEDRVHAAQAVKTLLLPGQMGERVKVMVLTRGRADGLDAFQRFDMTHRL